MPSTDGRDNDARRLATYATDDEAAATARARLAARQGHDPEPLAVVVEHIVHDGAELADQTPDGRFLLLKTGAAARVYDRSAGGVAWQLELDDDADTWGLTLHPSGTRVFMVRRDVVTAVDMRGRMTSATEVPVDGYSDIFDPPLCASADGRALWAVAGHDADDVELTLFDTDTLEVLDRITFEAGGDEAAVHRGVGSTGVVFEANGGDSHVVTRFFHAKDGRIVEQGPGLHDNHDCVWFLAMDPDETAWTSDVYLDGVTRWTWPDCKPHDHLGHPDMRRFVEHEDDADWKLQVERWSVVGDTLVGLLHDENEGRTPYGLLARRLTGAEVPAFHRLDLPFEVGPDEALDLDGPIVSWHTRQRSIALCTLTEPTHLPTADTAPPETADAEQCVDYLERPMARFLPEDLPWALTWLLETTDLDPSAVADALERLFDDEAVEQIAWGRDQAVEAVARACGVEEVELPSTPDGLAAWTAPALRDGAWLEALRAAVVARLGAWPTFECTDGPSPDAWHLIERYARSLPAYFATFEGWSPRRLHRVANELQCVSNRLQTALVDLEPDEDARYGLEHALWRSGRAALQRFLGDPSRDNLAAAAVEPRDGDMGYPPGDLQATYKVVADAERALVERIELSGSRRTRR